MIRLSAVALATAAALVAPPAFAQDHSNHGEPTPAATHDGMEGMEGMDHGQPAESHGDMAGMDHGDGEGRGGMQSALGPYAMTRDASGTAWQPDASEHGGVHGSAGGWSLMGHVVLNGVYDRQDGPRGGENAFVSGMIMGSAERQFSDADTIQFRVMLSPDALMGRRGYPLLFAAGESADGTTPLVDRQHPHDLFMELSASWSRRLSDTDSVFLYGGLPGEPAFGPPAFMHRLSIMDSPEAPISHHWLDSTHITFGVVTAGWVHDRWKLEASAFKGREPDEDRFDIEAPKLDSAAVRVSFNPNDNWSLQASWARLNSPEQLEPDHDQTRWSASAIYTVPFGESGWWSTTAAWGWKKATGDEGLNAFTLESAVKPNRAWTVFGRFERIETDELGVFHGPAETVSKASVGAVRDWRVAEHVSFGLGGLYAWNWPSDALGASYGGDQGGGMAFVRLKID